MPGRARWGSRTGAAVSCEVVPVLRSSSRIPPSAPISVSLQYYPVRLRSQAEIIMSVDEGDQSGDRSHDLRQRKGICRQGTVSASRSGTADLGARKPVPREARFRVASVTKSMVAATVSQLVQEGRGQATAPARAGPLRLLQHRLLPAGRR
ncbi:serine hydrolase [Nonomuraea sp. NPDC049028]|uniref:serine hydrolase n=1 Tax=Nonomuraea sp. NPDC049028 TaxID=3364348 RepID=UPI003720D415